MRPRASAQLCPAALLCLAVPGCGLQLHRDAHANGRCAGARCGAHCLAQQSAMCCGVCRYPMWLANLAHFFRGGSASLLVPCAARPRCCGCSLPSSACQSCHAAAPSVQLHLTCTACHHCRQCRKNVWRAAAHTLGRAHQVCAGALCRAALRCAVLCRAAAAGVTACL